MVFHWSLSNSKSPQISRTRLRILAVLSNVVVWIVSTRPPTSKSSRPFNSPLVILPNAPITIGRIVTFMFHSFSNSLTRSRYLSFFSLSFSFIPQSRQFGKFSFFLLIIIRNGLLARIRWSVCMLKSHRNLCVAFSRTGVGSCIYHLLVWSNFNFLHISQWIPLPTQSCLALLIRFFHISVSWLSFTGDWVTAILLKSPSLFSVFWPFSIILWFGWSPLVCLLPSPPVPSVIL